MKIRRDLDGKIYQVHDTRPISIAGVEVNHRDVLVTHPDDGGQIWLDGYQVVQVPDETPVDVP
jgi:hypothetical protein